MNIGSTYRIVYFDYGVIVKGYVPATDFFDLKKMFKKRHGYDYEDVTLANLYKATLCVTTEKGASQWIYDLGRMEDGFAVRRENNKKIDAYRRSRKRSTSTI
jgi:hypothetical protein